MWRKYLLVFKLSILDVLEYRFDSALHTLKYAFTISLMATVWLAVARETAIPAFSQQDIILYYIIAAIIYGASNFHPHYVEVDIKQGNITKLLIKPLSAFWYYFSYQSSILVSETLLKVFVFFPVIPLLGLGFTPHNLGLFLLYLPLIFFFCFCLYVTVATFTFWFNEVWAIRFSVMFLTRLLSGMLIPIIFFPSWYQALSQWLPFQYLAFTPIQLLLNRQSAADGWLGLGILAAWTGSLFILQRWVWKLASQSYEGTGI